MASKMKKYNYTFVLWKDSDTYDTENVLKHLMHACQVSQKPLYVSYILHDKDYLENGEREKPHYHVTVRYKVQKHSDAFLKQFDLLGLGEDNLQEVRSLRATERYKLHMDEKDDRKYKYSVDDVVTTDRDFFLSQLNSVYANTDEGLNEIFFHIALYINDYPGVLSLFDLNLWAYNEGISVYDVFCSKKYNFMILQLLREHNAHVLY